MQPANTGSPRPLRLWWQHVRLPAAAFLFAMSLLALSGADFAIARTLFFDRASMQWLGTQHGWVNEYLHTGGRWAIRAVFVLAAAGWGVSFLLEGWRALRRPLAYFTVTLFLAMGTVGLLKLLTNVDCPRDLRAFGGRFPAVGLFADRPDALRSAHCFPAAHASSGYALFALYFALRERRRDAARLGLAGAAAAGLAFGLAQQSLGAHFVSHDVCSAFIAWLTAVSVYTFAFKARLWESIHDDARSGDQQDGKAGSVPARGSARLRARAGGFARTPAQ